MGISRFELPAVHPEEEGDSSVEVKTEASRTASDTGALALSTPFGGELDAGWDGAPDPTGSAGATSAVLRLDEPGHADEPGERTLSARAAAATAARPTPVVPPLKVEAKVTPVVPGPAAAGFADEEDDFSDFNDPSVPPAPKVPADAKPPAAPKPAPARKMSEPRLQAPTEEIHLSPKAVVVVAIGPEELRKLPLDPQIMFVLTQLDGVTDLDTVLEMSGVSADIALDALDGLAQKGVIVRIS